MRRQLLNLFIFLCSLNAFGQGSFPYWKGDHAFGGDASDRLIDLLETTSDNNLVMGGHSNSGVSGEVSQNGFGYHDWWIVKQDTGYNVVWDKRFGGDTTDLFSTIIETSDGGYFLAGSSASGANGNKSSTSNGGFDYWIMKIDRNGNKLWEHAYGGSGDDILSSAVQTQSGYLLVGKSNSPIGLDKSQDSLGGWDYFIVHVDLAGNFEWDKTYGGTGDDIGVTAYEGTDELLVLGYSDSDTSQDKSHAGFGAFDYWLLGLDGVGDLQKDTVFGGTANDIPTKILLNIRQPGYWFLGTSFSGANGNKSSSHSGGGDAWVFKLDSAWAKYGDRTIGGGTSQRGMDIMNSPEGAVIVGVEDGQGTSFNYRIVKLDTTGATYWDRTYGGDDGDSLTALFLKCDRGIWAGGFSYSNISGDRTKANRGMEDYWVIELSVPTIPDFSSSNVCSGVPLNFYDQSDVWPDTWSWDFDDPSSANNNSTDQHTVHTFSSPGDYFVTLTIKEGCQNDTSITQRITVYENTVLNAVDLGKDFNMCEGDSVEITNQDQPEPPFVTYLWNTGDTTPSIMAKEFRVYTVTLSDRNCSFTDSVEVDKCPHIYYPNAFTPNADEINDQYFMYGEGIREFDLRVYNRWGQLIFHTDDMNEGWNGNRLGTPCQEDVYVFRVVYRGLGSTTYTEYGTITLIR